MPKGIYLRTKKHNINNSIRMKKIWQNDEFRKKNKGSKGYKFTEKQRENCKKAQIGNCNARGVHKFTKDTYEKVKKHLAVQKYTEKWKRNFKEAMNRPEVKKKLSILNSGKNHPQWQGGKSFEPYSPEFNNERKKFIRNRDNYTCQLCGLKQEKLIGYHKKLSIHHTDYNKKNCNPDNLITLCASCNAKVNFNRDFWTNYFEEKLNVYN